MLQPLSATSRVMKIGISSKDVSLIDMSMIAYWKIRARAARVPGVANVPIWGERSTAPGRQTDPEKLAANDVSLDQVMSRPPTRSTPACSGTPSGGFIGTGGFIDTPNQQLNVQHDLPVQEPADLAAGRSVAEARRRAIRSATWPT